MWVFKSFKEKIKEHHQHRFSLSLLMMFLKFSMFLSFTPLKTVINKGIQKLKVIKIVLKGDKNCAER